jgi:hypothetical protein
MMKRLIAGPLWFIATWALYDLVAYFTGLPRFAGPILGGAAAAFVVADPAGLFWRHSARKVGRLGRRPRTSEAGSIT